MAKRNKVGIGLDVGSRSVQLAVLKSRRDGITIEQLVAKDLPHDSVVEGQVIDAEAVTAKITELLREHHLQGKEIALAISGRQVMIKKVTTDDMNDDELRATIAYEAKSNLPFDLEDVSLDYARMPQDVETGRMDVLLVAAKNEVVANAVDTLRWAGGRPALLEAEPFALHAALAAAGYLNDQTTVAALQIGFQSTEATLFQNGQFVSNRNFNVGGKTYIEGLIRELGITFEKAASILARAKRTAEEEEAAVSIARQMGEKIAEQVERSFPEHIGAGAEMSLSRIVLCGGGAHLPMLESALRQRFGADVDIANPFQTMAVNSRNIGAETMELGPDYATAIGLALRGMGDDYPGFNLLLSSDRPDYKRAGYAGLGTVLPVVGISVLLFAMVMAYLSQEQKLSGLKGQLTRIRKEEAMYKDKIALVEELGRKRADVAARVDVIGDLDKNRFSRVRMLQLINGSMPELTWLTSAEEVVTPRGPGVNLSGVTSSNIKVSQLMTNLLRDSLVKSVDLLVSEQMEIASTPVTRFTVQAVLPDLGLAVAAAVETKPDMVKQGAQAVRAKRQAEESLKKEAGK
jgi:type IV pilus assembly protein PilM